MTLTLLFGALLVGLSALAQLNASSGPRAETDEELFSAYRDGDAVAFRTLFARYSPALGRLMRRRVGSTEEADELVQQTFLQLHRARFDFRQDALLRPWLYTIALNLRREATRKGARNAVDLVADAGHLEQQARVEAHDPIAGERRGQVRRALGELPEGQRTVIALHWFDGLSFAEVAEVLGANLSAVKVRAHRGYKAMRDSLEASGDLRASISGATEGARP
jgi:RNA polymerase sigma-70 factor (ECF subfamily)